MNYNSSANQVVKGKLVEREVKCCFSYEMDAILKVAMNTGDRDLPQLEEIENYSIYPEFYGNYVKFNGGDSDDKQEKIKWLEEKIDLFEDFHIMEDSENVERKNNLQKIIDRLNEDRANLEDLEEEQQEVYEWWIISEWFYRKLKNHGECVLAWGNNYYWGRCCTGQAILLDNVISKIAEEMEILEGQSSHEYWVN